MTPGDSDYERATRKHYQDVSTARWYAKQLSFWRSPADWAIGKLEVRAIRKSCKALAEETSRLSVVDLPAGTGKLSPHLTEMFASYLAVDISPEMMALMPQKVPMVVADAVNLPIPDSHVDVLVSLRLLHRVPESIFLEILNEFMRVVRVGLVFSYGSEAPRRVVHGLIKSLLRRPDYRAFVAFPEQIREIVRQIGGTVIEDRPIHGFSVERVVSVSVPKT